MSILAKRRGWKAQIEEFIKQSREKRERDEALDQALETLINTSPDVPRLEKPVEYRVQYSAVHPAAVQKGNCDCCGKSSIGWDSTWGYCPCCGNPISVEMETIDGQLARTSLEAARAAFAR